MLDELRVLRNKWLLNEVGNGEQRFHIYLDKLPEYQVNLERRLLMEYGLLSMYTVCRLDANRNIIAKQDLFTLVLSNEKYNNGMVTLLEWSEVTAFQSCIYNDRV